LEKAAPHEGSLPRELLEKVSWITLQRWRPGCAAEFAEETELG
jgi:hypothetical protein